MSLQLVRAILHPSACRLRRPVFLQAGTLQRADQRPFVAAGLVSHHFAAGTADRIRWITKVEVFKVLGITLGFVVIWNRAPRHWKLRNSCARKVPELALGTTPMAVRNAKVAGTGFRTGYDPGRSTVFVCMERNLFCIFAILWCMAFSLNGVYALCSPRGWRASWGKCALRTLDGPVSVRIGGAIMLLMGGFLLFEAAANCWTIA